MAKNFKDFQARAADATQEVSSSDVRRISQEELVDLSSLQGAKFNSSKAKSADVTYVKKSYKGIISAILLFIVIIAAVVVGTYVFTGKIIKTEGIEVIGIESFDFWDYSLTHDETTLGYKDVEIGKSYLRDNGTVLVTDICDVRNIRDGVIYCDSGDIVTSLLWEVEK